MPSLLTAAVIVCASVHSDPVVTACHARVFHGIYSDQEQCATNAANEAIQWEVRVSNDRRASATKSYAECFPRAVESDVVFELPRFMREKMGATTVRVEHFDIVDGNIVERKGKTIPKAKGVSL